MERSRRIFYQMLDENIRKIILFDEFRLIPSSICEYIALNAQKTLRIEDIVYLSKIEWGKSDNEEDSDDYFRLSQKVKKTITKDIYNSMSKDIQTYLLSARDEELSETQLIYLSRIPWSIDEFLDVPISQAKTILDDSHFGMETVKEKILRFIACQKHLDNSYGVVLLLVGPPGVGKTSIAASISMAMGRAFEKISLAGVSDALTLRGANSMFSDSKPGRIIESIIHAKTRSPLILLDEIDKMGSSTEHGDPAFVLLDILDSDRSSYIDGFLEVSIDLSKVVFIATANSLRTISPILQDRMEIVILDGYTLDEKVHIVTNYIWPKLIDKYKLNKLTQDDVTYSIDKDAIVYIIEQYTNEPGVRTIAQYCNGFCQAIISLYYTKGEIINNINLDNINTLLSSVHYTQPTSTEIKHKTSKYHKRSKPLKPRNL